MTPGQKVLKAFRERHYIVIDELHEKQPIDDSEIAGIIESESGLADLCKALSFARSVIKCGESWSEECDRLIDGALGIPHGQ